MKKPLIGIIGGKGKMGSYFADFFLKNGFEVVVVDQNTKLSNKALAKQADVVIVSVPMSKAESVIGAIAPHLKESALLMDFTSLKTRTMEAMSHFKGSYLGCHPMFAPTVSIAEQTVILCKGRGSKWHAWLKNLLVSNDVIVRELTAKKHDELMAYIQVLTHFSELGLADVFRKSGMRIEEFLKYQSPVYRLELDMMGRILNQNPSLYGHIQTQNPESLRVMDALIDSLQAWRRLVEEKDLKGFERSFKRASRYLGAYKVEAMRESDFLLEQLTRRKLLEKVKSNPTKKIGSADLAALGPEYSFSSLAVKRYLPKTKVRYLNTITEVFESVSSGRVKRGFVPIENLLSGSVRETLQNLYDSKLQIQSVFDLPVHHFLVALDKVPAAKIKRIYSHAQPLGQCRAYLKKHFPKAKLMAMPSTTSALYELIHSGAYDSAVICSEQAANQFNMAVLDRNIEDSEVNKTRFALVSKKTVKKGELTSIGFHFSADAPGTLYEVLAEFNRSKVNMTKIESLPNPKVPGGHLFFIDFEGKAEEKMLGRIKALVADLKRFGSYSIQS